MSLHNPQPGERWQHTDLKGAESEWEILRIEDGGRHGRPRVVARGGKAGGTMGVNILEPESEHAWHRVQPASPEPDHRADPAPGRTGMLALRCGTCRGTEWRRARPGEDSPASQRSAHFVCVTCERSGNPRYLTNDVYADNPPLLEPITLKELDALEASNGGDPNGATAPSA